MANFKLAQTGSEIQASLNLIGSNTATAGQVLTANGSGGSSWQNGGGGSGGANKIKYAVSERTGSAIQPTGTLDTLYINADVNPDTMVPTLINLCGEEGQYTAFYSQTFAIMVQRLDEEVDDYVQILVGNMSSMSDAHMYMLSTVTVDIGGDVIPRGMSSVDMSTYQITSITGVQTITAGGVTGSSGYGADNDQLVSLFSFNTAFQTSGSEGFTLYQDSTEISGQTEKVVLKTINNQSVIGSGNITIQGGITSFGGATGAITVGTGLSMSGNTLNNSQSSAEWGNITGTLSSQTDLNTALTAKLDATKCTYQTTAPTAAISDGGIHIVYLTTLPATRYDGYIYLIKE